MRTNRGMSGLLVILAVAVAAFVIAGCAEADRGACKRACDKLQQCDAIDNGENSPFDDDWLRVCKEGCDAANEINETKVKCINKTSCETMVKDCSTNG